MPVKWGRVINFPIPSQIVCHLSLLNLCLAMYGGPHPILWVGIHIMSASLMILVSLHGSICYASNLKSFSAFAIFKAWLSASLIIKFLLFNLIGVVNINPLTLSLNA
jgi:hypothetical protein